ncbi:MAG: SRPBCC family protein [Planctomycetes bacterium]|nr:SRPBCC family protein [Planctomycetota bacterium]
MKKAMSIFAIGIVSVSLLTLVIGLFLPDHWEAESVQIIDAPAEQLLPRIASFKEWENWATFEMRKADPSLDVTYSGPESGAGATFSWTGERMGNGRLTITKVEEQTVWYESAIQSDNVNGQGWIKLEHTSEGTRVTWHDEGKLPAVYGGYFAAMVEQNLKTQFSAALAKLKEVSEQPED